MLLVIIAMMTSRPRGWAMAAVKGFRIKYRFGEMLVMADDRASGDDAGRYKECR